MSRILWDEFGSRLFETGLSNGVLYLQEVAVPWNGLIAVREKEDGQISPNYFDGRKYLNKQIAPEFRATIEAYTYPVEFEEFDGYEELFLGAKFSEQKRTSFGLSYKTLIGEGLLGLDHGYKIHIIYNALVSPTSRNNSTVSDSVSPLNFSWDISTIPVDLIGLMPSAHLIIDSTKTDPAILQFVEDVLYGTDTSEPTLIDPQELLNLFDSGSVFTVTDNEDGTFTIEGPDDALSVSEDGIMSLDHSTVIVDGNTFTVSTG